LFLGMGGHVRRDVPAQVTVLRAQFPGVDWCLHDAVGENAGVIAALAQAAVAAATEATGVRPPAASGRTA
jgi:sirohydrochlorin cobaltochelatase